MKMLSVRPVELERLSAERGLGYLLITHNLALVDRLCASAT